MRTVYAQKNKKIILGRQGEDKAVRVVWPGIVSDWSSLYGDGSFQLSVMRFGDENAYPVVVEVNGDDIRFTVTSAETAIAGNGKCELTYIANGSIAKSATWETVVLNSLTGQTPSEPPEEPAKSWFTAIQGQIGNLANLETTSKDNLVAAINEAAQSGGGGGGSTVELDTTLSEAGKAADAKAVGEALAGKQNTISDLEAIRTGAAKGATALQSVPSTYRTAAAQDVIDSGKVDKVTGKGLSSNDYTDAAKAKVDALAPVATSGNYDDLTNKPTIPSPVTEQTVSDWGFTKNTGTYSKPSGGIPKTDLADDVQASLSKANSALQEHQDVSGLQKTQITDTGGYFTADTVEGALQEIGAELSGINTLIGTGVIA